MSATANQKRRVMSRSSGFSSSVFDGVRASSAIPQMGHAPGASRTICGCIGQVHCARTGAGTGVSGSRAIPHVGHDPGPSWRTSACMGHVKITEEGLDSAAFSARRCVAFATNVSRQRAQQKKWVMPFASYFHGVLAGSTVIPHTGSTNGALLPWGGWPEAEQQEVVFGFGWGVELIGGPRRVIVDADARVRAVVRSTGARHRLPVHFRSMQ